MEAVEDIVRDAFTRHERGEDLVREVLEREGASTIVKTVARLVATRAPHYGEALLFLSDGRELPVLRSAIESDPDLRSAIEGMLSSPNMHDRSSAIWALGWVPVAGTSEMLRSAAQATLTAGDVISLSKILELIEMPEIIAQLVSSDDWLLRWAVLPWLNCATGAALADRLRKQLAADSNPLIAGEASQHIAIIEAFEKRAAATEGWTFGVLSNHGPAVLFRDVTYRFVEQWPVEKTSYTLAELRTFILQETAHDTEQ